MDGGAWKRERELFSVALTASAFISSAFFKSPSASPLFVVNPTSSVLSFYRHLSFSQTALSTSFLQVHPGPFNSLSSSMRNEAITLKSISVALALRYLTGDLTGFFIYQIHSGLLFALYLSNMFDTSKRDYILLLPLSLRYLFIIFI